MKRQIYAESKPKVNKTQLRSQFVDIATRIRDLSKFEFVELLKNGEIDTALSWIDDLQSVLNKFNQQYSELGGSIIVRVLANGEFVGYIEHIVIQPGSRGWGGRSEIYVTYNVEDAERFASEKEVKARIAEDRRDIGVYDTQANVGYKNNYYAMNRKPGDKELGSMFIENNMFINDVYYADIEFEFESV